MFRMCLGTACIPQVSFQPFPVKEYILLVCELEEPFQLPSLSLCQHMGNDLVLRAEHLQLSLRSS